MKKKIILISLIAGLSLLTGCNLDNSNEIEENGTVIESVQEQVHEETEEFKESTDAEKDEFIDTKKDENNAVISNEENNNIQIQDETFITQMDDIYINLDNYIGKIINVEGFVGDVEGNNFKVLRLYDMFHLNHYDEVTLGINALYEGEIPSEESWVEITGIIDRGNIDGEEKPVVNVSRIEKKFTEGQKKVYN